MNADGTDSKRLTSEKGYDGGPFFSWDGKIIVYRAYHPKTKEELKEYESLLAQNLIMPTRAEIFMMSAMGPTKGK
jgi:TolB protein